MSGVEQMVIAAKAGVENITPGAVLVPRGMLESHADTATAHHLDGVDPCRRVILYCATGSRSALAERSLQELGYRDVAHLRGGLTTWFDEAGRSPDHPAGAAIPATHHQHGT